MGLRTIVTTTAAVGLALATAVGFAGPAAAAPPIALACPSANTVVRVDLVVAPGETVSIAPSGCNTVGWSNLIGTLQWTDDAGPHEQEPGSAPAVTMAAGLTDVSYTAPPTDGGSDFFAVGYYYSSGQFTAQYYVRICAGGKCPVAAQSVPDWVQAYGRSGKDAPCLEGWTPSWDQWPNGGTGGFVCQRSIKSVG